MSEGQKETRIMLTNKMTALQILFYKDNVMSKTNQLYNFRLLDEFKDMSAAEDKLNYMEKYEVNEDEAKMLRKDVVTKLGKTEIGRIQKGHAACSFIASRITRESKSNKNIMFYFDLNEKTKINI
jgi:hypothetical protein